MINMNEAVEQEAARIEEQEDILGKGKFQPFANSNSSVRKIMQSSQLDQAMPLIHPEPPIIQTGHEIKYRDLTSSVIKTDSTIEIVDKICKFESHPNEQYYLIYRDLETGVFDFYQRKSYFHSTEAYGYLYNNNQMDNLDIGYEVPPGTILRKSMAYDSVMNRCDGVNLITGYINCNKTMEDGIIISDVAAKKLASPFIKKVEVLVNENDILLNIFGDRNRFKSYPDIGEEITGDILCATRREKTEECLYMQSIERLSTLLISDTKYTVVGKVIDIDVNCNNPEDLEKYSNTQTKYYYYEHRRYIRDLINCIDSIKEQYGNDIKLSYKLRKLYRRCQREEAGDKFIDDKPFNGIKLTFYVLEENCPIKGDKITNRYGGKGVITQVLPIDQMPLLSNGKRLEVCFNGSTCVNRLNWGQLAENSVNFIGAQILEHIANTRMDVNEAVELIERFISFLSKSEADDFIELMYADGVDIIDREWYLDNLIDDGFIYIANQPISESMTIDRIRQMYKAFPFIKPYDVYVPITDSNNNIQMVKGRRPLYCGKIYIYRLKQYGEEQFSCTSLSSTNIKNVNTRNKANKSYRSLHPNTPIRFGEMESSDFMHMGADYVISNLMIHSVSPQARRLVQKFLTGDPYHVDIKLDSDSKNRNVEILNTYLKSIGYRIVFEKRYKKKKKVIKGIELVRPIKKGKPKVQLVTPIHPEEMRNWDAKKVYEQDVEWYEQGRKYVVKPILVQKIDKKKEKQ